MTLNSKPWHTRALASLTIVVAASGLCLAHESGHSAAAPGAGTNAPVQPFSLSQVRLGNGLFQEKRDRIKSWLEEFDERRFLILFNDQAGRPNPEDLPVPGGWEDGGLLSGHWAGHFMTALAQAYADQGEETFKTKLDWMVTELAACQDAITARMGNDTAAGAPRASRLRRDEPIDRVEGRFGSALRLGEGGPAQYVTLPQEAVNQLSDFTIAAWVKLASEQTSAHLFDFGHDTTTYMFLTPRATANGTSLRFAITKGGAEEEERIDSDVELPIGEWAHVAVTLAEGLGTLYVNGKAAGSNDAMTLNPGDLNSPGKRWLGRSQRQDGPLLDATIDEVHVFDRALTEEVIASMQDSAVGDTTGGNIAWYRFDEDGGTVVKDSSPNKRDAGIVGAEDPGDGDWIPTHAGYLGALPEDTVLRLGPPRWAVYGGDLNSNTWAPWYTQHKIMRGLLDAYYHTNNSQALDVVVKMADWAHLALTIGDASHPEYAGNLTRQDLNYMWDLYIAGEFGGANEVFPEIYDLTGDDRHLQTAKAFDNRASLFDAAVEDRDILVVTPEDNPGPRRPDRLHANVHVPQFTGYLRIHEQTGEQPYLEAAKNFYGWIMPHRRFASGGTGGNYPGSDRNTELFQNRGNVANAVADAGAETCTTYNLLKLGRNLFMHEQDAAYMDNYERGLFNMIAGSRGDGQGASGDDPLLTYFQPLTPGSRREYGNTGTCCGGTGLESHTKYQETVYMRSADDSALWVNLYVPSVLDWAERGFKVTQETGFPRSDSTKLTVNNGSGQFDLKLRVPHWAVAGFEVLVNGDAFEPEEEARPGSYLTLGRDWQAGDEVEIRIPFSIRIERALDRPDTQAIMWGPTLLQILGSPDSDDDGGFWELSLYDQLGLGGNYSEKAIVQTETTPAGDPLFTIGNYNLTARPYYVSDTQPVSSYFRRVEPAVVFGPSSDAGVPNRKRDLGLPDYDVPVEGIPSPGHDGPTFLDLVWDRAPFASREGFVGAVEEVAGEFVDDGVYSGEERDAIVEAARQADI